MEKYNFSKTIIKHHLSKKQRIFCFVAVVCMLFTGGFNLKAQDTTSEITVTGIVSDGASKNPVIGARVAIAETALSALTDENGSYTIKVATGSEVLVVTAEDYTSREIPVQGRKTINVDLYSEGFSSQYETFELMQGMKQRKAIIADPVSIISSGNFERSTSFSIDSDIQSRLGADARIINRSGVPGVGAAAFIRGLNSINANSQPLFIIDGVFWDNQMSSTSIHEGFFLNPLSSIDLKDIKSVTIVKDGNSLYGSKGSNGVILIETKRGKDMATRITADISFGLNQKPSFPKMMNASQYETYASNQIGGWFAANPRYVNSLESRERFFPFLIADPNAPEYWDYRNDTKWVDEVYQNGSSQSIGLSVSGGDNIALYHLSMGYTKNEGTLKETSVEKFNARFNSDIKMFSNILTKVDLFISQMSRDLRDDGTFNKTAPGFISLIKSPMLASHRLISGTQTPSPKLSDYDKMDPTDRNSLSNPVAIVEDAFGTSSRTGFNLKINPTLSITDNLSLGTTFAYTMSRVKESFFIPKTGIAPLIVNDVPSPVNEVRDMVQRQNSVFSDTRLNWKAKSGKNHGLNLFGGFRFTSDTYESMAPKGFNTGNDNVKILISAIQNKSVSGEDIKWKTISTYANVGYDYQKKYFLNLTASADASSRFGSNTKDGIKAFDVSWAIFPSASVAWLVSSEKFMKAIPEVNLLQLRASYGVTGNDDIDGYAARSYFESTELGGGNFGLVLLNIRNEKIQWETTKKRNVGLDVHLFDERVAFTADFFQSTTDNLLALKSLKSITGFKNYWANDGKLKNNGYEMALTGKAINTRNFIWELGASVGHYKNKVVALANGNYETAVIGNGSILTQVGQPMGVFYGYKTQGVFATSEDVPAGLKTANGLPYQAGDIHFADLDGNYIIDSADRQIIGDPNPDFYGNISTKFRYKRVALDVFFTYSYGNDAYNYLRSQLESGATFYNQSTALLNRWTTEGQKTDIPRAVYGDPTGNNVFSDRWIEDASYLRLKTIALSYEIPLKLSYIQGITVWGTVNNLYTWTKYLGSDPEFSMSNSSLFQGIDNGLTPQGRNYLLGVKINL